MTTRTTSRALHRRRLVAFTLPVLLAAGIAAASAPAASAADPIDGARTSGDAMFPNVGNGGYDALDYDVALAWTPDATQTASTIAGSIVATSTMTATAAQPLKSFSLDFEGLEIDAVTVNGVDAAWTRDVDPSNIKYKLIVTPATPVSGEFTTKVTYHGAPSTHVDADTSLEGWNRTNDGATMLGQPVGSMTAYPHNNTPADKATYTFSIDIPTTLNNAAGTAPSPGAAVSNGELASKTPSADGARTTWVWDQKKPMASELAIISIGRFDVIEEQFALSGGRTIPSWSFIDSSATAENKTIFATQAARLGEITRDLETLYGPYPGNSTGIVVDSVPRIGYALETQDRSFFPSARGLESTTLYHELIHQWYGNSVAPTTWTDIWIAEGMASWGEYYYDSTEGFGDETESSESVQFGAWNENPADDESWSIAPGAQTDSATLYEFQTYDRSAQFWQALRIAIGEDAFFAMIEEWQLRFAGTSKTGADVLALAEELSGRNLTAFYQDWILEAGKPAWPEKLDLGLTSLPATGELERGDTVTYSLTATNTGLIPLEASVVTVDVGNLLTKATIDTAALPAGVTLDGTTLTWAVPLTPVGSEPATATFTAVVTDAASGGEITTTAAVATLGGTCLDCESVLAVQEYALESVRPVITGTPEVGATLTAVTDGWPADTAFTYQWELDGEAVEGATANTFTVPTDTVGSMVTVTVTGSKSGYVPSSATSAPVGPITLAAVVTPTPTPTPTSSPLPPTGPDTLPATGGSAPWETAWWALGLIAIGALGATVAARRRAKVS
ncbi:M1 family aminopeptidase [Microbacterium sp. P07]|uniref:M1 family aminopeptidase n=1 Tax=Microbacterium sp. P07 TaxID=3366952 RepID=UPI003746FD35